MRRTTGVFRSVLVPTRRWDWAMIVPPDLGVRSPAQELGGAQKMA
jgi:hypothetical protein